jgi:hypothetical protein
MATPWRIEPMWQGQPCAVLASGPSMSADVAECVRRAATYRVIAVNNTFRLAPWADMLYAADAGWWSFHKKEALAFDGHKVTCTDNPFPEVLKLREGAREGFDADPGTVCTGGNSGYQAIHVAAHCGSTRILLCGFDMHGAHWHERHEPPLREHGEGLYAKWIARFATLAPPLAARGIEVINCTPGSALTVWPFVPLSEALGVVEERGAA